MPMTQANLKSDQIRDNVEDIVLDICQQTKKASQDLRLAPTCVINQALELLAKNLRDNVDLICRENEKDITAAETKGLSLALIDRLMLDEDRINAMANGVETVMSLEDPTNKVLWEQDRPNGLKIQRISCSIGVLGMIYESRPNVTIDAAILCLKSHNAVVLRGGSESLNSSLALHKIIQQTLTEAGLPQACVSMIPTSDRAAVGEMLKASDYIDVMIPRGGHGLIDRVMSEARMPVFGHLDGICHIYVHESANIDIAKDVTKNAKMRRTGICGAMETLLLDKRLSEDAQRQIVTNILETGCEIVGDKVAQELDARIKPALDSDWKTEYLDAKLSCRIVENVNEAIEHINTNGSHHTDAIIAEHMPSVKLFQQTVDSGIVMHNASTQFADGGEFGMGAEIGIATGKMHARGPVGLEQLCTYKYIVHGNGQTRP